MMDYKANIGDVDTETEGVRRNHDFHLSARKPFQPSGFAFAFSVVEFCVKTLLAEVMVQLFHVFYRIAVDDDTLAFVLA